MKAIQSCLYVGLMSGTSLDAVDVALVDFSHKIPKLVCALKHPIPGNLHQEIIRLCSPGANEIQLYGETDVAMGRLFATAVAELLKKARITAQRVIAIGSHGQTIRHTPSGSCPFTIQIGDPNTIAERTGINTIADFRRRDMAAGGQGAPLAPAFHAQFLSCAKTDRAVLNLGGIANLTLLPKNTDQPITGFDTGPANLLIDYCYQRYRGGDFDPQGQWAAGGKIDELFLEQLLREPYFKLQPPKSTGRELFNPIWLDSQITQYNSKIVAQDLCATLVELVAASVSAALQSEFPHCKELLICGGGVHNCHLIDRLGQRLPGCRIKSTAELGIDPDYLEAMAFAWFASRTLQKKTSNLPAVTGARHESILGGIYYA